MLSVSRVFTSSVVGRRVGVASSRFFSTRPVTEGHSYFAGKGEEDVDLPDVGFTYDIADEDNRIAIAKFRCQEDNYGYLVHDKGTGNTVALDSPDGDRAVALAKKLRWNITDVLNTHDHDDHVVGNSTITKAFGAKVTAPMYSYVKDVSRYVMEGDTIDMSSADMDSPQVKVLDLSGHTKNQVGYFFPIDIHAGRQKNLLFCGDALFPFGCGRVMPDGSMSKSFETMNKLRDLPPQTDVYCGHEYAAQNAAFFDSLFEAKGQIAPNRINERLKWWRRYPNTPSGWFSLEAETMTNPFMLCHTSLMRELLDMDATHSDLEVFTELRTRKDNFKGMNYLKFDK